MDTDFERCSTKRSAATPLEQNLGHSVRVNMMAHAFVRRWGDYAPTEAAFRGDDCLRRGDASGQRFWLHVVLASEDILRGILS